MRFSLPEPVFLTRFATAFLVRIFGTTASFLKTKSYLDFAYLRDLCRKEEPDATFCGSRTFTI